MLEKLIGNKSQYALFILRVILAAIFFAHGAQKLMGFFGGAGIKGTVTKFTELEIFLPNTTAWIVALIEFLGGIFIFIGLFTREFAFMLAIIMVGATVYVHGKNGFFITPSTIGYEYNFALIGACLCMLFGGGGSRSAR